MIRREFNLSPAENATIAVLITENAVKELGELACIPRQVLLASGKIAERKYSAIEIAWRAADRASSRAMLEQERNGWH
jgi:hypothetical protein